MIEHEEQADRREREADELQERSERLREDISGAREDCEAKRRDESVPGTPPAPKEHQGGDEDREPWPDE